MEKEQIIKEPNNIEKQGTKLSTKERPHSHRELKLKTLKADAESLKQSLTAYKTEYAQNSDTNHDETLNELVAASGVKMGQEVLEHVIELLRLGVNPDKILHVFQVLTKLEEAEMVSII